VPGVADIVSLGGLVKQYEVRPDLAKLRDYKVTLGQLSQAIQRGNANAGGSYVEQGRQQYLIRGIGLFTGPEDIENVVVAERGGTPILVRSSRPWRSARCRARASRGRTPRTTS
jgi:cobalt-zinc-cadmium resistance protein CzcA